VDTINHMIRVAASNVTLNGYDFGLAGGWGIYIEPGVNNTVIQNCNFLVGSNNQVPINAVGGAGSLTVQYNTINGGGGQRDAVWALVNDNGSGTFIAQYNNFLNAPCDAIDFGEAAIAPTIEYNVFYNLGTAPESHPDPVQYIGDVVNNALEQFNTIYQPQGGGEVSGEEGVQVAAYGGSTITNAVIRNNVIIAKGPALTMSYSIAVIQSPGNTINGVVVGSNYIDYRGAYGPFYPPSGSNLTFTGNVDLATGTQILSPSGTASRAPSTCCPWDDERRDGVSNKRNRVSASLQ